MSQRDDSGFKSFVASEAIELYDCVKMDAGADTISKCDLAEKAIGTAYSRPALAAGDTIPIKLLSAAGTHKVRASEALAIGSVLYSENDGEVQDTAQATAYPFGIALEAAGAANDIIEALAIPGFEANP